MVLGKTFTPPAPHESMFSFSRILKDNKQKDSESSDDNVARVAIDESGNIIYASTSFCILSEHTTADLVRKHADSLISFTDPAKNFSSVETGVHPVRINGHNDTFEFQFDWLTLPGERRYLVASEARKKNQTPSKESLRDFESKILQVEKINDNRRKSAPALNLEDLNSFAALSDEIMVVVDDQGDILRGNTRLYDIFGLDQSRLHGTDFVSLFHDEDRPFIRSTIQTFNFGPGGFGSSETGFEARIMTTQGERWTEWKQTRKGNLIYCIGHDVTAIKMQEQALSRREKQLTQAESIGRMGHWHWTIGAEDIEWSDEIYRIFGVEKGEFIPTLEAMNKFVNRRDIARVDQALQRAIIEQNDYDVEFSITQPGGDVLYVRCEGRCGVDATGEAISLYGIMQDITERTLHEHDLRKAKDAAERAYAAKSQFLANMSHELRTPLNAIIGFSEMMQQQLLGPIGTEKYLEYIGGIRESGGHLLDLISDILDMSKIEAGKYDLAFEEFSVDKVIKTATHMVESRTMEAGVKLSVRPLDNEGLKIIADRRGITQILLNLLSNAIKFTPGGGQVALECFEREDYIAIKVSDNGIGIPANKLAQITRPFEQASSHYTRNHEGSGLGLAITKELTEMHGGSLHIESSLGVGTTVTVRLPYNASKFQKKAKN